MKFFRKGQYVSTDSFSPSGTRNNIIIVIIIAQPPGPFNNALDPSVKRTVFTAIVVHFFRPFHALLEIWDKMAEIMQITIQYGDQIRL